VPILDRKGIGSEKYLVIILVSYQTTPSFHAALSVLVVSYIL